ncbi:MAG TPA: isoprenylcysteine carboxylmethyltransferase family protein [Caulobacteraceae bacterium]
MSNEAKAWSWMIGASVVMALVMFACAGTIEWWQGWAFIAVVEAGSVPVTLFMIKDPALLESRTNIGPAAEQRPVQRVIVVGLLLVSVAAFIVPSLDRRFGWSHAPVWVAVAGDALVAVSLWLSFRVFLANSFGAATVQVVEGQTVISTGPYAVVRNPMYSGAVLFFVGMALALGSWWALIPAALTIPAFSWRLLDEEAFLADSLPGYRDYQAKVRWRLIPGVF